jgi:death-on-curing protein
MSGIAFHNQIVASEYARWGKSIGAYDPYLTKWTIGLHEVLQAHFLLVDFFHDVGEGIGGAGPKDVNLLHSALARQFAEFGGRPKWNDRIMLCASVMYGLIKNHPFHDANKRTAFLSAILHLQKIGRTPIISHEEFEDFTVDISDDKLHKYSGYEATESKGHDKNVIFMARFLKK